MLVFICIYIYIIKEADSSRAIEFLVYLRSSIFIRYNFIEHHIHDLLGWFLTQWHILGRVLDQHKTHNYKTWRFLSSFFRQISQPYSAIVQNQISSKSWSLHMLLCFSSVSLSKQRFSGIWSCNISLPTLIKCTFFSCLFTVYKILKLSVQLHIVILFI